jgi:hypothetical protein
VSQWENRCQLRKWTCEIKARKGKAGGEEDSEGALATPSATTRICARPSAGKEVEREGNGRRKRKRNDDDDDDVGWVE